MQLQDVKEWLRNSQNYSEGVKILKKYSKDDYLIGLLESYEAPFTRGKLIAAMEELMESQQTEERVEEIEKTIYQSRVSLETILNAGKLPAKIQMMKEEKGKLFKEVLELRQQMKKLLKLKTRGVLTIKEVLELMEQTDRRGKYLPFSITYITYNSQHHTGGDVLRWDKAVLANMNVSGSRVVYERTPRSVKKNPNHWKNSTRNIHPLDTLEHRKVHIWLIMEFNGMEVTLGNAG